MAEGLGMAPKHEKMSANKGTSKQDGQGLMIFWWLGGWLDEERRGCLECRLDTF